MTPGQEICQCLLKQEVEERMFSDTTFPVIKFQECNECDKYVAIWQGNQWIPILDMYRLGIDADLNLNQVTFKKVFSEEERIVLYLLSQVSHNQYDRVSSSTESPFSPFAHDEVSWLCCFAGEVVGFFTVKEKGTPVEEDGLDCFCMTMVDTIYVRKTFRRHGLASAMLNHLLESYPNESIGFSDPLSIGMTRLLQKFLKSNRRFRDKFWLCSFTGEEGYRANLWFELKYNIQQSTV